MSTKPTTRTRSSRRATSRTELGRSRPAGLVRLQILAEPSPLTQTAEEIVEPSHEIQWAKDEMERSERSSAAKAALARFVELDRQDVTRGRSL